jgi:hypothetical protein
MYFVFVGVRFVLYEFSAQSNEKKFATHFFGMSKF